MTDDIAYRVHQCVWHGTPVHIALPASAGLVVCRDCGEPFTSSLKDEAPGKGPGAPGVEPSGCSPPAPTNHPQDTPASQVATTPASEAYVCAACGAALRD